MEYKNPDKYKDYWKTAISEIGRNYINIRGYPLSELVGQVPYTDAIILCLRGELPDAVESRVINAVFTAAMDHQFLNATALAGRVVVSANPDPIVGIAAGVLSFGKVTAGVPSFVVEVISAYYDADASTNERARQAKKMIDDHRERGTRVPGFGHPLHDIDGDHYTFRARLLHEQVTAAGLRMDGAISFYEQAHTAFMEAVGKQLPINVDGLMGAIFTELGYEPLEVHALAPFTMLPGIVAHVIEEIRDGVPLRIVPESAYVGPALRSRNVAKES